MHATITAFIDHLKLAGRITTAGTYGFHLKRFDAWLTDQRQDVLTITVDDIRTYQQHLSDKYRSRAGRLLSKNTQGTCLAVIKSFYAWLLRRGEMHADVAADLQLPRIPINPVRREHLNLQEATAMLQAAAAESARYPEGCARWALAVRDLAILTLAIASGRRRSGLLDMTVAHIDLARAEVRVEREKGSTGRVLPIAAWAVAILRTYIEHARPILNWQCDNQFLFVGDDGPQLGKNTIGYIIEHAQAVTVAANPDLVELAGKRLTPHSMRVTFASLLFGGGASIRTINEMLNHKSLGMTARYLPVDDAALRRALTTAHPRA